MQVVDADEAADPTPVTRTGGRPAGIAVPAIVNLWRTHWAEFVPFLAFPREVRRVVYTTNLIESMNARLRKITRKRNQFPTEQAAPKVLYLAVRNLDQYRGRNTSAFKVQAGNKRSKRSRSNSRDASPHHDRNDHLHRRSDVPVRNLYWDRSGNELGERARPQWLDERAGRGR